MRTCENHLGASFHDEAASALDAIRRLAGTFGLPRHASPMELVDFLEQRLRAVDDAERAERQIRASLAEKEVLLKEVHHRVKNNLQVISSLLSLQSKQVRDPEAFRMFQESRDRVHSIALFHEKLYQSKDLGSIEMSPYLDSVVQHLILTHGARAEGVAARVLAERVTLGVDVAIPCGLIVNELVSNVLKHAFPDGRPGSIEVVLRHLPASERGPGPRTDDLVECVVRDDGVGFPAHLDPSLSKSLGLQLVSTLAEQIGGRIWLDRKQGTSFHLQFASRQ